MLNNNVWKSVEQLQDRKGSLFIDGCDVKQLAQEFGTPLYVYSKNRILANYHRLVNAYRKHYPRFEVYYALKANNNPAIVKILADAGAGADASCLPEVHIAQQVGIPKERILYSGVYNSNQDLRFAAENGVRLNLEDTSQLDRLSQMRIPQFLCFRVNPGVGGSGNEGLVFAGPDAKFGILEENVAEAYKKAKDGGVERFGIHMMTGSNILDPEYFEMIVEKLMDIAGPISRKLGIAFDFIDIGGSLGVPYKPDEKELAIEDVAERVVRKLRMKLRQYQMGEPLLIHEPGRYLVSDAGILVTRVTSIKHGLKKFIGLDSGMHTLLRPALYGSYHHLLYAQDLKVSCNAPAHVVGQVCENTDIFARDRMLPSGIAVDDVLAFLNAGAYGFCMSSQYNSKPRPAEVLAEDGKAKVIRTRETYEDLLRGTIGV